ncbi:MAG: hypothetical protein NC336_09095 [Clostridium sp.]|nr:hypothetical protein [Clostridium sp.]
MKKFYAIAAALLCGVAVVTAKVPGQSIELGDLKPMKVENLQPVQAKLPASQIVDQKVNKVARAPRHAAEITSADIVGMYSEYGLFRFAGTTGFGDATYETSTYGMIVAGAAENEVEVTNLLLYTGETCKGIYNPVDSTLTIKCDDTHFDNNGTEWFTYAYDYITNTAKDIVLKYEPESQCFYWEAGITEDNYYADALFCGPTTNIGTTTVACYELTVGYVNNQYQVVPEGATSQDDIYSGLVRTTLTSEGLEVWNFLDSGFILPFYVTLDSENRTATVDVQGILDLNVAVKYGSLQFGLGVFESLDGYTFELEVVDGKYTDTQEPYTALVFPMFGINYSYTQGNEETEIFEQAVIFYDGELFEDLAAGVSKVEVDNSNAPVEFFNLQGVKVNGDNLGNGVYIRRQGSDVQKVLVK